MQYKTHIVADKGLCAPVKAGDKIGTLLVLDQNNIVLAEIDIITNRHINNVEYHLIESEFGHDGFLVEHEKLNAIIDNFINNREL